MERLTIKSEIVSGHYSLKCMCSVWDGVVDDEDGCSEYCELHDGDCNNCEVQQAFDRLAAYEDTGLTPDEIKALQADNERLRKLIEEIEDTVLGGEKK